MICVYVCVTPSTPFGITPGGNGGGGGGCDGRSRAMFRENDDDDGTCVVRA